MVDVGGLCRASTLHDQIIQQHEEQQIRAAMAAQQREEDVAGEAFEATLSESESESEAESGSEEALGIEKMEKPKPADRGAAAIPLSEAELQQNHEDFRGLMEVLVLLLIYSSPAAL